jgi:hypothetical protein
MCYCYYHYYRYYYYSSKERERGVWWVYFNLLACCIRYAIRADVNLQIAMDVVKR